MEKFRKESETPEDLDTPFTDSTKSRLTEARKKEIMDKIKKERENRQQTQLINFKNTSNFFFFQIYF